MKPKKSLAFLPLLQKSARGSLLVFSVFIFLHPLGVNGFISAQIVHVKKIIFLLPPFQIDLSTNFILTSVSFVLVFMLVAFLIVMNKRLNKARLDLSKLNTTLESQIEERIAALSQINHDMEFEIIERKRVEEQLRESEEKFVVCLTVRRAISWLLILTGYTIM